MRTTRKIGGCLLVVALIGNVAEAQNAAGTLTISRQQAVDSALAHNPGLDAVREQLAQARARKVELTAFPDPEVSADYAGLRGPVRLNTHTGSDVSVGLALPFPSKFLLLGRIGNADIGAAEFGYLQLQQETASGTVQAYNALLVALQHHDDLREADSLAADFLKKTQARFEGGTVAHIDVIKARVDLAQAENDLISNERDIVTAQADLNRLLGRTLGGPLQLTDSLSVPDTLPPLDPLLALAQGSRPELSGLTRLRAGAHAATALAQQYWLPDFSINLEKNVEDGSPNSYTTSIGFTVPLMFWNHQRGEVSESRHRERELAANYRDLAAQVEQEVRTAYANAATAYRQAVFIREELLPEAQQAYRIALASYGLGGSSALEVLDARRTLLAAESQYAEILGAANDARAELERAIGIPLATVVPGDPHAR